MNSPTTAELTSIEDGLRAVTTEAQQAFGGLTAAQLNWKPAADSWSIAQCFDHLITANTQFFPEFDRAASGTRKNSFWESVSPFSGMIGRKMLSSLDPASLKRLPAPKGSLPSKSDLPGDIIEKFAVHQREVVAKVAALEGKELGKTVVTSPFLKLLTYRIGDGLRIMLVHEQRHLGQAKRVMQAPGFPQA